MSLGLTTYRWNNNLKSMLMVAAFPCLLIVLVGLFFAVLAFLSMNPQGLIDPYGVGFSSPSLMTPVTPVDYTLEMTKTVAPIVFGVAALWIVIGSLFNEGIIRMATHAKPIERKENPDIYNLLENLCISRGLKMPKLFMIDAPVMNAYASGLSESSYAITVTKGLVQTLKKDELEAVLAHELTHITNRDVRLLIMMVLFGGMLSFFAEMVWRSMRHASFSGGSRKGKGGALILIVAAVVLSIGYLVSTLLRLALSRRREYLADAGAVELTKNPGALIGALKKISGKAAMPEVPSGVQAMMIENPPGAFSLFATHPPIEERIEILRQLGGAPDEGDSIIPSVRG